MKKYYEILNATVFDKIETFDCNNGQAVYCKDGVPFAQVVWNNSDIGLDVTIKPFHGKYVTDNDLLAIKSGLYAKDANVIYNRFHDNTVEISTNITDLPSGTVCEFSEDLLMELKGTIT